MRTDNIVNIRNGMVVLAELSARELNEWQNNNRYGNTVIQHVELRHHKRRGLV